ncbi:hypothetical protein [Nostoc sp. 'Peltigera membranacea cyanobiont' 213]|uniref:hypothetical protein n=1 Tax=Nostoc sp. 'Peltigera membranacea cyanobiont' 213 TaxID=2014530 RepID=UPI00117C5789|nr:hypothetical protein [Nostoc sp. 'Peltigera membranacea cyanobiont' 213]
MRGCSSDRYRVTSWKRSFVRNRRRTLACSYEPYDWQLGELDKGLPIKYVPGMGVVIFEE